MNNDSMRFVVYMVHKCANQWGMSPSRVYQKLMEAGCIEKYLVPFYDVLRTESSKFILEDIEQYLEKRGIAIEGVENGR